MSLTYESKMPESKIEIALLVQTDADNCAVWRNHTELYEADPLIAANLCSILNRNGYLAKPWLSLREFLKYRRTQQRNNILVFSLIENCFERNRPCLVPAVFELYNLPYIGSDPYAQLITSDKQLFKDICASNGLLCPRGIQIDRKMQPKDILSALQQAELSFPLILKYRYGSMSYGLRKTDCFEELALESRRLLEDELNSPLLCEEYISGEEATIPIVGTSEDARTLSVIQYTDHLGHALPLYDMDWKERYDSLVKMIPYTEDAQWIRQIKQQSLFLYRLFGLRDMSRIDLRITKEKKAYFLEINCIPNLSADSAFDPASYGVEGSFEDVVLEIVRSAEKRCWRS